MNKFIKYSLGIFLSIFVIYSLCLAQTIVDRTTSATFNWLPVTTDTSGQPITIHHYEIKLIRDVSLTEYNYATPNASITILKPRSGVFKAQVRAAKQVGTDQYIYSEWCSSITSCASPAPWKVRFKPSAPLGPIIISNRKGDVKLVKFQSKSLH